MLPGVAQWIECCPVNQKVAGWILRPGPHRACGTVNYTLTFLSLSFSLPSSLSKNKYIFRKMKCRKTQLCSKVNLSMAAVKNITLRNIDFSACSSYSRKELTIWLLSDVSKKPNR